MKKKDQRKQKKKRARQARLRAQKHESASLGSIQVMPPGAEKMSEVILDFLEPWSQQCRTDADLEKLLPVALVAWNAAIASGSARDELIGSTLETIPREAQQDYLNIVGEMIRHKERYFAANRRLIIDYQVAMTPDGPHLSVISTLDQP
jgi:hypothetical protein